MKPAESEAQLLRLLQQARLSPPALDPWEAWKVFKRFLEIPVDDVYDAASFQYSISEVEGETSTFGTFTRQFSTFERGVDEGIRQVVVDFEYSPEEMRNTVPVEVWTHDYPSLADFSSVVEAQPQFQDMCNCTPRRTDVWSEEL